jgi:two-component system chemotaxis sensor kinase CheA
VRLRLPLTLAIIDGMLAQVGAERYVVPTLSIVTSLRPRSADLVSVAGCGQLLKVHGQFVPVIPLGRLFEDETDYPDPTTSIAVIVESEGRSAALLVDALLGQRQFVIKPLGRAMCRTPGISGGAIMPDGSVGLILDVGELIRADTKAGHFQGREAVTPSDEREEPTMKLERTHARS